MHRGGRGWTLSVAVWCVLAIIPEHLAAQTGCFGSFIAWVPMADGTLLYTRVALPEGDGPWPVVLTRTPYYDGDLCSSSVMGVTAYDYVHVIQNSRGRGESEGEDFAFVHDGWGENQDGYDCVLWILDQPWCNGVIGVYGGSLRAAMGNFLAGSNPPNIYGEWLARGPGDFYKSGICYFGGALRWDEFQYMSDSLGTAWESAILEHPTYDAFWKSLDVTTQQSLRNHPVITWTGWYDTYFQSSINNYLTIRRDGGPVAREESKLVIAMSGHGEPGGDVQWPPGALAPGIDYGRALFDDYLKGISDFGDRVPTVTYFLMGDFDNPGSAGNVWRRAEEWPVPAIETPVYLHADRSLQLEPPRGVGHSITYTFDPADPVLTLGGAVHGVPAVDGLQMGPFDQRPVESRPDVILFETKPLPVPVEVVGKIDVRLWGSSDALDTDFTAKLTDVYPDGKSIIITDGIIRARARDSLTDHTLMAPGTIYEFTIDLWSTAIAFNTGHRIRVAISSSNYPRFQANPNTGADIAASYDVWKVAQNTIYFDSLRPSHIILPIVGPDFDGDTVADWIDRYPDDPNEWADVDHDEMGDNFEQRIADADGNDSIVSIDDVDPNHDFDNDGSSNLWEYIHHTDPIDPESNMPLRTWTIATLAATIIATVIGYVRRFFEAFMTY